MIPTERNVNETEPRVRDVGNELIRLLPAGRRSLRRSAEERMMDTLAASPATKAALFRLVDVAPMCRNRRELSSHLYALLEEIERPPKVFRVTRKLAGSRMASDAVGLTAAVGVRTMAGRFIVGRNVEHASRPLKRLWTQGVASTVDLLGEATVTEGEADAYAVRCERALVNLAEQTRAWPAGAAAADRHGALARANLSIKVSALTPHTRREAPWRGARSAADRLRCLMRKANALGAHLHIDMESLDLRETVTELVFNLLDEREFRDGPSTGLVLQAYLKDSEEELLRWIDWARTTSHRPPLKIRLVKGAYWDHELVQAKQAGWEVPVFETRAECDRNFEALTRTLVRASGSVRFAVASHNIRSISHAIAAAEEADAAAELELQILRGLGDELLEPLSAMGYRVRAYCPVGDLVAGMAYLVRRLLENTSNDSFLRTSASTDDLSTLLVAP